MGNQEPRFPRRADDPPYPNKSWSSNVLESPYQGLNSFTPNTAEFFLGREETVKIINDKLASDNFVPIIGRSGSGKSSVLHAGVRPALDASIHVICLTPGSDPIGKIIASSEEILKKEGCRMSRVQDICSSLRSNGTTARLMEAISPQNRYIIFVDQFEEVFTLCASKGEQQVFVNHLTAIAGYKDFRLSLVLAIRADFVQSCLEYRELTALFQSQAVYVAPMNLEDLRRVIQEPAKKMGYDFPEGLTSLIIDDIGKAEDYLPLLQYTLTQLWNRRNKERRCISLEDYTSLGRVTGCLNECAENMFNSLDESQQSAVKSVFMRLVRTHDEVLDAKQRRSKQSMLNIVQSSANPESEFNDLLDQLIKSRLITLDDSGDWIDLAHEALMVGWSRFADWRQEDRTLKRLIARVEDAYDEWKGHDYSPEYLIHGGLLNEIQPVLNELDVSIDGETFRFCLESIESNRTKKRLIGRNLTADMAALASLAKTRLALPNYQDEAVLRIYSESSQLKNLPDSEGLELLVDEDAVVCGDPEVSAKLIWNCILYVKYKENEIPWGQVFVNASTCRSELLLDNRPLAWIGSPLVIDGAEISKIKINGSSLTAIALRIMEERFAEYYKSKGRRRVMSFGGFLKDSNLRHFQHEYAKIKELQPDNSDSRLCEEAIGKTSFGRARIDMGISAFTVWTDGITSVNVPGLGFRSVPASVVILDAIRPAD
ncbi:MAG: hypothetical protein EB059_10410 [Alphaproteobacteria bacterium]|nr:hypothetical protein [Alphaproteobacteria bacterium]